MHDYIISEGLYEESYLEITIRHTKRFSLQRFNEMYHEAYIEGKKEAKRLKQAFSCEQVANAMCRLYGFKKVKPRWSVNIDKTAITIGDKVFTEKEAMNISMFSLYPDIFISDTLIQAAKAIDEETFVEILKSRREK